MRIVFLFFLLTLNQNFLYSNPTWVPRASKPSGGNYEPAVFAIEDNIFVVGGTVSPGSNSNAVWVYDVLTDSWSQISSYPGGALSSSKAFSLGQKGYVIGGGLASGNYISLVYSYNPATNTWAPEGSFGGGGRYTGVALEINGTGYFGTGYSPISNDWWSYNAQTLTWSQKASLPGNSRQGAIGFSINGKGYLGLGSFTQHPVYNPLNDFYEYDPITNSWSAKASFPQTGRWACMNFVYGNQGYVGCGIMYNNASGPNTIYSDFYKYDPVLDTWTFVNTMPGLRYGGIAAVAGGRVFGGLGYNGSNFLNSWYELTGLTSVKQFSNELNGIRFDYEGNVIKFPDLSAFSGKIDVRVYTSAGTLAASGFIDNNSLEFYFRSKTTGTYIVYLTDKQGTTGSGKVTVFGF